MSQVQEVKANGTAQPVVAVVDLQAQLDALKSQLLEQLAENKRLRETPQVHTGAQYRIVPPSEDYPSSALAMTLSSGGRAIMGPRKKFLDLIEEVKSGRLENILQAHPEVK